MILLLLASVIVSLFMKQFDDAISITVVSNRGNKFYKSKLTWSMYDEINIFR